MLGYGCLYDFVLFCFILLFFLCRFFYFNLARSDRNKVIIIS